MNQKTTGPRPLPIIKKAPLCVFLEEVKNRECGEIALRQCTVRNWKGEERTFTVCIKHLGALLTKANAVKAQIFRVKMIR